MTLGRSLTGFCCHGLQLCQHPPFHSISPIHVSPRTPRHRQHSPEEVGGRWRGDGLVSLKPFCLLCSKSQAILNSSWMGSAQPTSARGCSVSGEWESLGCLLGLRNCETKAQTALLFLCSSPKPDSTPHLLPSGSGNKQGAILVIGLSRWLSSKEPACRRRKFNPRLGKIPWRRKW